MSKKENCSNQIWFDPDNQSIGFGQTYGEHIFNGRPLKAIFGLEAIRHFLMLGQSDSTKKNSGDEKR